jgi:hypothetical protein
MEESDIIYVAASPGPSSQVEMIADGKHMTGRKHLWSVSHNWGSKR